MSDEERPTMVSVWLDPSLSVGARAKLQRLLNPYHMVPVPEPGNGMPTFAWVCTIYVPESAIAEAGLRELQQQFESVRGVVVRQFTVPPTVVWAVEEVNRFNHAYLWPEPRP